MKHLTFTCIFIFAFLQILSGQDLYLPKNFESSYQKGFRTMNGEPGPKYWQNRAEYNIQVKVEPKEHEVEVVTEAKYFNNSPDSLRRLRIKVQHDLYRKGGQRNEDVNPKDITEGVDIQEIEVDGVPLTKKILDRKGCYLDLRLPRSLGPGASLNLKVKWEFKIPSDPKATRECVCTPGSFFIPYFYPEIAVYDDLHGWADVPYNGLQEFYHDFSSFDVQIQVPKGYVAWATGEWQNAAGILKPEFVKRWEDAHNSETVQSVFNEQEITSGKIFLKNKSHTYHFIATDVPDFTFAISNHYNWDASSVVVDEQTGRKAFISAVYNSSSLDFQKVAKIAADGVRLMSRYLPGYPFPYPCLTVFNGNDGMEYPMMINDASTDLGNVMGLTVHESAHTYFPFMMGVNEQYYAWMDEGWANFFEHFTSDSLSGKHSGIWGGGLGSDWDVPPMVPSVDLTSQSYWFDSYTRPQLAYTQLLDMLGYDMFHKCMKTYMDRWKGKHPGPYEFFNTFNDVSGMNLNWFWKPWFFEFGSADLAIASVSKLDHASGANNQQVVEIEKKGNIPVPVHLVLEYTDGSRDTIHQSAAVWKNAGQSILRIEAAKGKTLKKIRLGEKTIPDSNPKDNSWEQKE